MNEQSPLRLAMLGVLLLGLFASLFARMWYLQVVSEQREAAQSQAVENLFRTVFIEAPRGRVLDRNGNVLIDNRLVNEVIIDKFTFNESIPNESDRRHFAVNLAREISAAGRLIKASDIEDALADPKYGYYDRVPIATDVPERFSIIIGEREHEFPGVRVRKTTVRFYPYGTLGAHLLGYVAPVTQGDLVALRNSLKLYQPTDVIGQAGVEASLEDILRGTPGVEVIEVDAAGDLIRKIDERDPVPGDDVMLTIDVNLQALVETELARGVREARDRLDDSDEDNPVEFNAPGGAMVLLDPQGARILAMASYPTFDQRKFVEGISTRDWNLLRDDPDAPWLNRATQGSYAPGSTFKLITAYAALDSGLLGDRGYLRRNQYLVDEGIWKIPNCDFGAGCRIENAGQKPLGDVDLRIAIAESSNIYFGQLGYQFDVRQGFSADQLIDVAKDFGYATGADAVAGSMAGQIPAPDTAGQAANLAVGQGLLLATPLQMANSYAALGNGGKVYAPMLAEYTIDAATEEILIDYPERLMTDLYMPEEYMEPLITGMRGVTSHEKGTAYDVFEGFPLDRFLVLGKTGTVENEHDQDHAAFAAIGPWPNPRYAAVTYIEQAGLGGEAAAPVVKRVFERIARNEIDVVPTEAQADDLISEREAQAEEERLRSEREAQLEADRVNAEGGEADAFEVLVPDTPDRSAGGSTQHDDTVDPELSDTEADSSTTPSSEPVEPDTVARPEDDDSNSDPAAGSDTDP